MRLRRLILKRTSIVGMAAVGVSIAGGCAQRGHVTTPWDDDARSVSNAWAVRSLFDDQAARSVETRRVVYPSHFVEGTATLTKRGARDVRTIGAFLARSGGGDVYMSPSSEPIELLTARRATVREAITRELEAKFVPASAIVIHDSDPVMEGTPATRARTAYVAPSSETPYDFHGVRSDD